MLNFRYSKSPENLTEIFFSSLRFAMLALPYCLPSISIIAIFTIARILMLELNFPYPVISLLFQLTGITLATSCLSIQAQSYADNNPIGCMDMLRVLKRLAEKIILVQLIAYILILAVSYVFIFATPFLILPYIILIPVAIFEQGSVKSALKNCWRYVSGNRFFMIYAFMFGYAVYKVFKLSIMYLITHSFAGILAPVFYLSMLVIFNYFSLIMLLVVLHNMVLRYCEKKARKEAAED